MRIVHEITELRHPTTTGRPIYSPLEAYWKVFQVWRKRRRLQTELCGLTDHELMDIGITRGEIDYVAYSPPIPRHPLNWMSDIGSGGSDHVS